VCWRALVDDPQREAVVEAKFAAEDVLVGIQENIDALRCQRVDCGAHLRVVPAASL
jgi:hypothetical protein